MKSKFEEAMKGTLLKAIYTFEADEKTKVNMEMAFDLGVDELRKSLKCESCKHFSKRPGGLGFCENEELDIKDSLVAYDFGCINHQQKEEKR